MKTERTKIKTNKNAKLYATGKDRGMSSPNRKTPIRNIFAKTPTKINPRTQFLKIKEALKEVEMIKAGKIKPKLLDELLNEL